MKHNKKNYLLAFFFTLHFLPTTAKRSIFRQIDPRQAYITIKYHNSPVLTTFKNPYLQYNPLFTTFDKEYFFDHQLPDKKIYYRNQNGKFVRGKILKNVAQTAVKELISGQEKLTHFKIIKARNFHFKSRSGLITLKYKDFPFILKLSIERPDTFTQSHKKGWEPACIFVMGGANRHLAGFSRVPNSIAVKKKIDQDKYWSQILDVPRKWYWLDKNWRWLEISGQNMAEEKQTIQFPSVYAIVADEIIGAHHLRLHKLKGAKDRQLCIKICNFLDQSIDTQNFNYITEEATKKLVLIDTEYFPLLIGWINPKPIKNYTAWNKNLFINFMKSRFSRDKALRLKLQKHWPWHNKNIDLKISK